MIAVQSLSCIQLFVMPWTAAHWASSSTCCPSSTPRACSNSHPLSPWCHPTISSCVVPFSSCPRSFPSIRVFSNESALHIRWSKYWSFRFSISPFNEYSGPISFKIDINFFYGINFLLIPDSISWSLGEKIHFNRGFTGGRRMVTFRTNTNPGS